MASLRPVGEHRTVQTSSQKVAKSTRNVLLFLLSLSFGYLCGTQIRSLSSGRREQVRSRSSGPRILTLTTTNGSPYQNYQMRIAYASYQRMLAMPGGEHHVAFTRILHRTARDRDVLAEEVPTFRADPLQPDCDDWCPYPVSDRANAVAQYWAYALENDVLEDIDWVYMIESDYVFVKPLLPPGGPPAPLDRKKGYGFYFSYITPTNVQSVLRRVYDGPIEAIQPTGPAPLLMTVDNWLKITPGWEDMAARIEADETMKEHLGWVREMYGFDMALAKAGIEVVLDTPKEVDEGARRAPVQFIREPPLCVSLDDAHAFHYTLPTIIERVEDREEVWRYDKRVFTKPGDVMRVPKVEPLPGWEGDGKFMLADKGTVVEKGTFDLLEQMVQLMNAAIADLPPLR